MKVLNPMGFPPKVTAKGLAPSLPTVEGSTIFLVDIGFENSDRFMKEVKGWFDRNEPSVSTRVVQWKDEHLPDPETCELIKNEGDAAILGVGL